MKNFALFFLLIPVFSLNIQAQPRVKLNIIKLNSKRTIHSFFNYTGNDVPIISGHRGGIIPRFPENSIEAMENTLKYTPAFFEIDPRLTKDSVIVLFHDANMERTSNGKGKVIDYTWAELQQLRLKDINGNVTNARIPKLEDVINWARGKTILNLDKKDVPFDMTVALIRKLKAEKFVMITVHNPEQGMYYYEKIPGITFSAHVLTPKAFEEYDKAGFPWKQSIAYIGPHATLENKTMYDLIYSKGAMCMISAAPTYDKLKTASERAEGYRQVIKNGAGILESDLPIEASIALKNLVHAKSSKRKFFTTKKFKNYLPDVKD